MNKYEKEQLKNNFAIVGIIGSIIIAVPLSIVMNGICLMFLWKWFIASYFDIKEINIFIAMGVVTIPQSLNIVNKYIPDEQKDEYKKHPLKSLFGEIVLRPLTLLLFGLMIHGLHLLYLWLI